jgi:hypothetical protein
VRVGDETDAEWLPPREPGGNGEVQSFQAWRVR